MYGTIQRFALLEYGLGLEIARSSEPGSNFFLCAAPQSILFHDLHMYNANMKYEKAVCLVGRKKHAEGITKRTCPDCRAFRQRRWRLSPKGIAATSKRNRSLKKHPGYYAKMEVFKAVRSGRLKKAAEKTCADCGDRASVYDHRDYRKPLVVEAVCRSCNHRRGAATK